MNRPPSRHAAALASLLGLGGAFAFTGLATAHAFALFAGGAAHLAAFFSAASVQRVAEGWLLHAASSPRPLLVSQACAALDFFLLLAPLLAWHLARRGLPPLVAALAALVCAAPLNVAINTLRLLAVAEAHRWVIPRFPPAYADFLHLLAGAAVFLPALLLLNLALHHHARPRPRPSLA